ncbi:MAG: hypothetical protein ACJAR3_002223 [Roseivirga sp.]|jgi:hypothetical protein
MIKRPKITTTKPAKKIIKIHCGECNWLQEIATESEAELKCCPWCGWSDLDISKVSVEGIYQSYNCEKHGEITVVMPNEELHPDDIMDDLWCPFCE